jgi:hypothetical protein
VATKKTAAKKQPLEKELNKQIIQWLDILPSVIYFERINSGKVQTAWGTWIQLAKKGHPDFIALIHGDGIAHVLFIEAKRKGEKQRDDQKWFQDKVDGISNVHYLLVDEILTLVNKINDISDFQ